jgi:putative transposase
MSRAHKFKNPEGLYFITFATIGWVDVFTRIEYKNVFIDCVKYCQKEKGLLLYAWCLMTNHVHLIAKAKEGFELPGIMRDMKKFTSKKITAAIEENIQESRKEWIMAIFKKSGEYNCNNKKIQFWQQNNKPIELWTPSVIQQKLDYIHYNPVEVGVVEYPEQYLYSSARNFAGGVGLIELEVL